MREEIVFALISVFAVAFASFASYDSADRWQRLALGAILLASLAVPVGRLISGLSAPHLPGISYSEQGSSVTSDVAEEALCNGIRELVADKFSLPEDGVQVSLRGFVLSEMKAERVYVTLFGKAALGNIKGIEEYIENEGFGECEVNISLE